jgi:hypothetical protein
MDLDLSKERVVHNPFVQGSLAYYSTYLPATSSACAVIQNGSLLAFDVIAGSEPGQPGAGHQCRRPLRHCRPHRVEEGDGPLPMGWGVSSGW